MARANLELIGALRRTAARLSGDVSYQWGHMGMCNCGHLAQSITGLAGPEIHQSALIREGDWEQQARDYCPTSGNLIDVVLAAMFDLGLTRDDVRNLERLSDPAVVRRVGRYLRFNQRDDVVLYMRTWADLLACHSDPERCEGEEPVWAGGTILDICAPPTHTVPSPSLRSGSG